MFHEGNNVSSYKEKTCRANICVHRVRNIDGVHVRKNNKIWRFGNMSVAQWYISKTHLREF